MSCARPRAAPTAARSRGSCARSSGCDRNARAPGGRGRTIRTEEPGPFPEELLMSRLIRMDHTGHTTIAEWSANDPEAVEAAVQAFRAELDRGYFGMVSTGEGRAEQVRDL